MSESSRIVVHDVWKKFRRGALHDSLRDLVPALARRLIGKGGGDTGASARDFWALQELSFTVQPGEVLGIIGANGAGKSTTLKLLNGIMDPTRGTVEISGRVAALIEVSAGFHQDLTGRQNVFLQGAIMGMRKAEVARKFDDIVAFSGTEQFIDTPVKRYSSGMNARLGFAIAAHLEPDVLLIDEVLAVGDRAFQAKAFARIKAMASAGAPVVLVSHQMDRVAELCTHAILLDAGRVRLQGTPAECINAYLHGERFETPSGRHEASGIEFHSLTSREGLAVFSGETVTLEVRGTALKRLSEPQWEVAFRMTDVLSGTVMHWVEGSQRGIGLPEPGDFSYEVTLQMNARPGVYNIEFCIWDAAGVVDVLTGPHIQIEVLERLPFWGEHQLNSQWNTR